MRKRFFSFFVATVNCQLVPLNDEILGEQVPPMVVGVDVTLDCEYELSVKPKIYWCFVILNNLIK